MKTCQKKQANRQKEQNYEGSENTITFTDLLLNVMCYENVFSGRWDFDSIGTSERLKSEVITIKKWRSGWFKSEKAREFRLILVAARMYSKSCIKYNQGHRC